MLNRIRIPFSKRLIGNFFRNYSIISRGTNSSSQLFQNYSAEDDLFSCTFDHEMILGINSGANYFNFIKESQELSMRSRDTYKYIARSYHSSKSVEMRRKDKQLQNVEDVEAILLEATVCRLGLYDEERKEAYIVPLNYGVDVENRILYFHSASTGRKNELMRNQEGDICFEIDIFSQASVHEDVPCKSTQAYRSIIGYGRVTFLEDIDDQIECLEEIMKHQTNGTFEMKGAFNEEKIGNLELYQFEILRMDGKESPCPDWDMKSK